MSTPQSILESNLYLPDEHSELFSGDPHVYPRCLCAEGFQYLTLPRTSTDGSLLEYAIEWMGLRLW